MLRQSVICAYCRGCWAMGHMGGSGGALGSLGPPSQLRWSAAAEPSLHACNSHVSCCRLPGSRRLLRLSARRPRPKDIRDFTLPSTLSTWAGKRERQGVHSAPHSCHAPHFWLHPTSGKTTASRSHAFEAGRERVLRMRTKLSSGSPYGGLACRRQAPGPDAPQQHSDAYDAGSSG